MTNDIMTRLRALPNVNGRTRIEAVARYDEFTGDALPGVIKAVYVSSDGRILAVKQFPDGYEERHTQAIEEAMTWLEDIAAGKTMDLAGVTGRFSQ